LIDETMSCRDTGHHYDTVCLDIRLNVNGLFAESQLLS